MSTGGGSGGRAPMSEINVTPLVDVMLVLLIIFMVTAPLMTAGVEVDLPNADAPNMPLEDEKVLLVVDENQEVFIVIVGRSEEEGGRERTPIPYDTVDQLRVRLQSNQRVQTTDEIFIQADQNVPYGFVAQVLATVRQAGVESVGLVTDPRGESAPPPPAGAEPAQE
ncbi:MAG TPA: ExbD/TolR family protein [Sandaracinaceae bacterium LLY-WYZ-13_1]|nr:ExbD/TolR family protein [Sandaracinaceae bacterium LLY-WYZ-13_1]